MGGGVVGGRVQVGALSLQPACGLLVAWPAAGRNPAAGRRKAGRRGSGLCRRCGGRRPARCAGSSPAAGRRRPRGRPGRRRRPGPGRIRGAGRAAGSGRGRARRSGAGRRGPRGAGGRWPGWCRRAPRRRRRRCRARVQAEPAEQPLLAGGQVPVGQVERGGDRQVLGLHQLQPVPGRGQLGGQVRRGPGRVMAQLAGHQPDRQRQVPAQPGDLDRRGAPGPCRGGPPAGPAAPRPRPVAGCPG